MKCITFIGGFLCLLFHLNVLGIIQTSDLINPDKNDHNLFVKLKEKLKHNQSSNRAKNAFPKLIRHTAHLLEKFYSDYVGYYDYALSNKSFNNLTLTELIMNLRQLRNKRSFISKLNRMTLNNSVSVSGASGKKISPIMLSRPLKKLAEIEGDIVLGGLMMVHERGDTEICGAVMPQGGIQALETMLYTVDYINRNTSILPGIKLGVHILDDCDKDTYGLEQAVEFIKGSISNIDDVELGTKCSMNESLPSGIKTKVITGVVGAASSVTSIQVANLLRLFKIPQVSFFSTSPELSNKQRYDYFARTIPSDKNQVQVMIEIIDRFKWKYVSIIYEESNYGIKALEELERLLPKRNICIAAKEMLVKDSGVATDQAYDLVVKGIQAVPRAKGVIIFGSDQEVKALMAAVRRRNATGSFTWIGSDGWSSRTLVSDGNEREVQGTLSVQPRANPVHGFDKYFLQLNLQNNYRNPWFVEFWEHHFKCKYPNSTITLYNKNYDTPCTGHEKLTLTDTQFEAQLQFVSDAVMAFAYAIRDMHNEICGKDHGPGICDKMNPIDGSTLLNYLKNVKFIGLSGDDFHFDSSADGPARYNIIHFRWVEKYNKYAWIRVGEYNEGNLTLDMSKVRFPDGTKKPPNSVCSDPCGPGEAKGRIHGTSGLCCWNCIKCLGDQIRAEKNESFCSTCSLGTYPNKNHTSCDTIPERYLQPGSTWAIMAMLFAGGGIISTVFVITVFIVHNDTPVVKASGRELSYVLLLGIFTCYALTFLFVIRPNDIICGVQQFCTGVAFTGVYGALLTKTNRIARIFQAGRKSAQSPSFVSPRSQLVIWFMLLSIQVLITVVWILFEPPKAIHHYPTRGDNLLVCNSYINVSYSIAFAYPVILIIICTLYAIRTRKIPEAYNESKYIGFTMYTTCIIWLAFVPIYFSTANQVAVRITSMSVAISLSATVMLVCLFTPKLYIILIHPERNVRQKCMMPNSAKYHPSSSVGSIGTVNTAANSKYNANCHTQFSMAIQKFQQSDGKVLDGEVDNPESVKPKLIDQATQSDTQFKWSSSETQKESHKSTQTDKTTKGFSSDDISIHSTTSKSSISSTSAERKKGEDPIPLVRNCIRRPNVPKSLPILKNAQYPNKESTSLPPLAAVPNCISKNKDLHAYQSKTELSLFVSGDGKVVTFPNDVDVELFV